MASTHHQTIEGQRQTVQERLDSHKSAAERNKWGQFATPFELSLSFTRYMYQLRGKGAIRFLDPAIGTGSFFSALMHGTDARDIEAAVGVELDPTFAEAAEKLWGKSGLHVIRGDFTTQKPAKQRFNLVLSNPPYVRHHHIHGSEKDRLRAQLADSLHLEISGLAGLYCYFLLLCHDWMEECGLALWLIPSEFMDVNYGATLRRYLADRVTLLHLHRFCPTDVQFTDALVSSAVVIFKKSPPPPGHHARFSFGGPIEQPNEQAFISVDVLRHSRKWTQFPGRTSIENNGEVTLGDIFFIKRGLATGSNSFFILNSEQVSEWKIPRQFLKPILPGPRYVAVDTIEAYPNGDPTLSPRVYLLDCSEPEERIKHHWPRFFEYLQKGHEEKIAQSYLASHRAPWYSQEQRPPAPFLCTYMGRTQKGKNPFRFIWNRSRATAHNVYLMLYPRDPLLTAIRDLPELEQKVFHALQRITPLQLVSGGRVYGGGLHKVEPKELAQITARDVLDSIKGHVRIQQQGKMFE